MDKNALKIRTEALSRGITALYHFTAMSNLPSILLEGLASRQLLDAHGIPFVPTDAWREDRRPDALSLSIQDLNWAMFSRKLKELPYRWAILELQPSILWTHKCRFCWKNAASKEVRDFSNYLGGPWGFGRMFCDEAVSASDPRSRRHVSEAPPHWPTWGDAEVQVFTPIHPDLIVDITVASDRDRANLESWMAQHECVRPVEVNPDAFARL